MSGTLAMPHLGGATQEKLIDALRAELGEYGALLELFDAQQAAILARQPDEVLGLVDRIEAAMKTTQSKRKEREVLVTAMAPDGVAPKAAAISDLLPLFREPVRPLLEALRDEINRLISHTRRRARQNQALLARTVEVGQELLRRLDPEAVSSTYSARGRIKIKATGESRRLLDRS